MTEEEAREQISALVPRETMPFLEAFVEILRTGSSTQNLIAASTIDQIWARHILDSAQLLPLAGHDAGLWVDVGSGAGLPGIVVALARQSPSLLIEPRTKRAAFLDQVVATLGIAGRTSVVRSRAESVSVAAPAAVISARAVSALPSLFAMTAHFADVDTLWLLPKGRSAAAEVASLAGAWQGAFGLVPSLTDSDAAIVVARRVRPEGQG